MTVTSKDLKKPHTLLATWFGCGLAPKAPGTWGSLGAYPFGLALYAFTGLLGFAVGILLVTLIGFWATARFETETQTHDSKMIVIDEVAGQWIALLPALILTGLNPLHLFLAFPLFRFFDIIKPWPVSFFDKKVSGALGVMGDDIIAGIYAAFCAYIIIMGAPYAKLG